MSKVKVHRHAEKYLQRLPKETEKRIKDILRRLEQHPLEYPGAIGMVGEWAGYHRIRVGNLRIVYWFDKTEDIVYVDHIGPRADAYK
jgi:mRNA interferase RelE/StbE